MSAKKSDNKSKVVVYAPETPKPMNSLGFHYFIETNKQKLINFYTDPSYPNKTIIDVVNDNQYKRDKTRSYYKLRELCDVYKVDAAHVVDSGKELKEVPFKRLPLKNCAAFIGYETIKFQSYHYQEQEYMGAFVAQLRMMLKNLKKGGFAAFRVFDMYCPLSLHLFAMLRRVFEEVEVFKPLVSLRYKSDRFVVCKGFKDNADDAIAVLDAMAAKDNYDVVKVLHPAFEADDTTIKSLQRYNHELNYKQYVEINKMITYINKGNYYGDDYEEFRREQDAFNAKYERTPRN